MFKKPENLIGHDETKWLKDLTPIEKVGFEAAAMISCQSCGRKNPPNRFHCLYCAAELEISANQADFTSLNLRPLEHWEKGWNVVSKFPRNFAENSEKLGELAHFLQIETAAMEKIASAEKPLPVARVESKETAEIIARRLQKYYVESLIIADEALAADVLPIRIRAAEFAEDEMFLVLLGKDEVTRIKFAEFKLFVGGSIISSRRETSEQRKRNAENKVLESTELSADETILDFYTAETANGFRISTKSFDFSCLENEKKLLAAENFRILLEKLRTIAPNAEFDENYRQLKNALNAVWQIEPKTDRRKMQHTGIGQMKVENIVTTSNLTQFTRYSRLLQRMKAEGGRRSDEG